MKWTRNSSNDGEINDVNWIVTFVLKKIKQRSDIELINKTSSYTPKDEYSKLFFEKDIKATQIYNIEKKSYYYNDFLTSPIKI